MPEKALTHSLKGHLALITLNRPQQGNAVDITVAQELADLSQEINHNADVYAVVVTGSGTVFCSGTELSLNDCPHRPAASIAAINCPVVAAINGDALGPGLEIALACDVRIASSRARFGFPQIGNGVMPFDGGTQRLSRLVGKGKAMELLFGGETIDAAEAKDIGLVSDIADDPLSKAEALAQSYAAKGPVALRFLKEAVNKGLDLTLEQGIRLEGDLYFLLHTTADRTEGITAFLQKRPPEFKGK